MSDIKNQERVDFVMWAKDSLNSTCFAYDELIDSLKEQEEDTDVFAAAWIAMAIEDNLENHGPDRQKQQPFEDGMAKNMHDPSGQTVLTHSDP